MNVYREDMGLSVTRMAQLIDVSRSLVSLYESGKRNLPPNASLMEWKIEQLWTQVLAAPPDISATLNLVLEEQEQMIDEKIHRELIRAQRKWDQLNKKMKGMPDTFLKGIKRYRLVELLSGWPELQKMFAELKMSRLTQEKNIKKCSPSLERWLHYRMELAQAQKELALKWGMKPVISTQQKKGKLRSIQTPSEPVKRNKKEK